MKRLIMLVLLLFTYNIIPTTVNLKIPTQIKTKTTNTKPKQSITFLTAKEIKADKNDFSKKCSSLLVTNDLKLPKGSSGEADVIKVFKKISQALKDQKVVGVIMEKENYLVVGTTQKKEARKVINNFLKDENKNGIPGKAVPKEPKKKSQRNYKKKL